MSVTDHAVFQNDGETPELIGRNVVMCLPWILLAIASISVWDTASAEFVCVFMLVYAIQVLVAEAFGVRVDSTSMFVPRRPIPFCPFVVLWRQKIALNSIEYLTSKSKAFGCERAIVRFGAAGRSSLLFTTRYEKLYFVQFIQQLRPGIAIYRRR